MNTRPDPTLRRCGRIPVKLLLGVLGLLLGGLLGLGAMAPGLASKHGAEYVQDWFAERYRGTLEVGALDLAWRRLQTVERLEIHGLEGERILTAKVVLAPLLDLVRGRGHALGTIEVELEGELVQYEDGTTNLSRALEAREPEDTGDTGDTGEQSASSELPELDLVAHITRLVLTDAGGARPPVVLVDTRLDVAVQPGGSLSVRLDGGLGEGRGGGALELAADIVPGPGGPANPVRIELHATGAGLVVEPYVTAFLQRPAEPSRDPGAQPGAAPPTRLVVPRELLAPLGLELDALLTGEARDFTLGLSSAASTLDVSGSILAGPLPLPGLDPAADAPWDVELKGRATGWATELVDALAEQDGLLSDVFGSSLDLGFELHFQGTDLSDCSAPLELSLDSPNAALTLSGSLDQGRFVSGEGRGLSVAMGLTPLVEERVVGSLLPMLVLPEGARRVGLGTLGQGAVAERGERPVRVSFTDLRYGLESGLADLSGSLSLELGAIDLTFLPGIRSGLELPLSFNIPAGTSFGMQLVDGLVNYEQLPIRIKGRPLPLAGSFDLSTRKFDLQGSLPASLWSKELEKRLGVSGAALAQGLELPFSIGGSPESPRVSLARPDLSDVVGDSLREGLRGELEKALGDKPLSGGAAGGIGGALEGIFGSKKKSKQDEPPRSSDDDDD